MKKELVIALVHDRLDSRALESLGPGGVDMIVGSCFTRLGGSGLVRWVPCHVNGEPAIPGHAPFSAVEIADEDVEAGQRIIARTIEAFA